MRGGSIEQLWAAKEENVLLLRGNYIQIFYKQGISSLGGAFGSQLGYRGI